MTLSAECVLQYKSFPNAAELWTLLAATHPALADPQNAEMSPENQKSFGIQLESGEIHFSPAMRKLIFGTS